MTAKQAQAEADRLLGRGALVTRGTFTVQVWSPKGSLIGEGPTYEAAIQDTAEYVHEREERRAIKENEL